MSQVDEMTTQPETLTPGELSAQALYDKCTFLARNLWWSWHPEVINLFRDLDPIRWRQLDHNPIALLKEFTPERLSSRAAEMVLLPATVLGELYAALPSVNKALAQFKSVIALGKKGPVAPWVIARAHIGIAREGGDRNGSAIDHLNRAIQPPLHRLIGRHAAYRSEGLSRARIIGWHRTRSRSVSGIAVCHY